MRWTSTNVKNAVVILLYFPCFTISDNWKKKSPSMKLELGRLEYHVTALNHRTKCNDTCYNYFYVLCEQLLFIRTFEYAN